jgi:hypothetical protein
VPSLSTSETSVLLRSEFLLQCLLLLLGQYLLRVRSASHIVDTILDHVFFDDGVFLEHGRHGALLYNIQICMQRRPITRFATRVLTETRFDTRCPTNVELPVLQTENVNDVAVPLRTLFHWKAEKRKVQSSILPLRRARLRVTPVEGGERTTKRNDLLNAHEMRFGCQYSYWYSTSSFIVKDACVDVSVDRKELIRSSQS